MIEYQAHGTGEHSFFEWKSIELTLFFELLDMRVCAPRLED